ncbi:MerR family transcriptional regulator [Thalassiella azotivora]
MLTISQLAAYAGVTVRAVRHYHRVGLLPEPERDRSGYRVYDAAAVVRLIRIRTLAEAGVPLARVEQLLDAPAEEFAAGVQQVDAELRAAIRRLQGTRRRLATLTSGERLALPRSVVDYLDRLRGMGVDERYLALERDSWIMIAAKVPDEVDAMIATKHAELDDPEMVRLYHLLSGALDWSVDDPRVVEVADILERLMVRAVESGRTGQDGELGPDGVDDAFVELLDAAMVESAPVAQRLLDILAARGWKGWTRIERAPEGVECRVESRVGARVEEDAWHGVGTGWAPRGSNPEPAT